MTEKTKINETDHPERKTVCSSPPFYFFCFHVDTEGCLGSAPSSQLSTSQTPPIQLPLIGTLGSRSAQVVDWMACWVCKMNWPLFHPEEVSCRSGWQQSGERFAQLLSPLLPSTVAFVPRAAKGGFCLPVTGVQCRVWAATHPSFGIFL